MKRWHIIVPAILVAPYAWLVAASAIYLTGMERFGLFQFPYLQWIAAAKWWNYSLWVTLWVSVGALIPTLVIVAIGVATLQRGREKTRRPNLYGETGFANRSEMQSGGFRFIRKPFE